MTDNQTDTSKVEILPGVQLTPEAQAVLNKQLNRRIVWGYRASKILLVALALSPLFATVFFGWVAASEGFAGVDWPRLLMFTCGPAIVAAFLFFMARRY